MSIVYLQIVDVDSKETLGIYEKSDLKDDKLKKEIQDKCKELISQIKTEILSTKKHLDFKTVKAYRIDIKQYLDFVVNNHADINRESIDEYLSHLNQTVKPKSVKRKIAAIKSFFSYIAEKNPDFNNPFLGMRIKISQRKSLPRTIPLRVINLILKKAHEQQKCAKTNSQRLIAMRETAVLELLFATGIRVSELCGIYIEDLSLQEGYLLVHGKGNKERTVYFDARTKVHLSNYLSSRSDSDPALFVTLSKPHNRLQISGVETRLKKIGKKLGIIGVHPHKFRRTLATRAIDKGMPIEQVQTLLGHQKIDTTLEYAMVSQQNVKTSHSKFIC